MGCLILSLLTACATAFTFTLRVSTVVSHRYGATRGDDVSLSVHFAFLDPYLALFSPWSPQRLIEKMKDEKMGQEWEMR